MTLRQYVCVRVCVGAHLQMQSICVCVNPPSQSLWPNFFVRAFKHSNQPLYILHLGGIKMNINSFSCPPKMYTCANSLYSFIIPPPVLGMCTLAFKSLWQAAMWHLRMTFFKHISRRMSVGRQRHSLPLTCCITAKKSNTFWQNYYIQKLIGREPRRVENVLVLANCLKWGRVEIMKTSLSLSHSKLVTGMWVFLLSSDLGCEFQRVKLCPVSLKLAPLMCLLLSKVNTYKKNLLFSYVHLDCVISHLQNFPPITQSGGGQCGVSGNSCQNVFFFFLSSWKFELHCIERCRCKV